MHVIKLCGNCVHPLKVTKFTDHLEIPDLWLQYFELLILKNFVQSSDLGAVDVYARSAIESSLKTGFLQD